MKKIFLVFALLSQSFFSVNADEIVHFEVQPKLAVDDVPVVRVQVKLDKTRDLHVAVQDIDNNWKQVTSTMKRIKKSGNYHFEMPLDDLKVGNYKWNAYITPRGKNWNDKIGEQLSQNMQVVKAIPKQPAKAKMSQRDVIQKIAWPEVVSDNAEHVLEVKYAVTQARDLHFILYDKKGWKNMGNVKITVAEPGVFSLPISNILAEYPEGEYAWTVWLAEVDSEKQVTKPIGKHFKVVKP
ncbi:hypothetical protein DS2_13684 [Catenovulum agarivorans DS-2]|uniref:DUF4198 domain-containing protein n=1 Tax=Catenovulum agarivorans DS-2 TaxID=1328313 RepID=W7QB67_9ALTE|nr:hypothetical protein [Catenovulum agarivorans]EWH09216.1 hypothetical protein DS2_13684 [Catenovulum agarivorans DS-2]